MTRTRYRSRLGAALIVGGLLLNPWTIGYLATQDGTIDNPEILAACLFFASACILGGLQLLWHWCEPLSWGRPVGFLRGGLIVGLFAFLIAGGYWGLDAYGSRHSHTTVVGDAHLHATPEQQQWADDFYKRSLAAALKHGWFDFDNAMAQGFQVDRVNRTHFPNLKYMFDDVVMDPERPEWLVYDETPNGKVLMALMFFTRTLEEVGPTPGGPIAQWHFHPYKTTRCAVGGLWTIGVADDDGTCAEGIPVTRSPEMFHVWFIDHPLGRFTEMKIVSEYFQEVGFDFKRLHPMVVHFAIALFAMAVLLDLAALATRRHEYHRFAWISLAAAAVSGLAAVATGMTAEALLKPTHEAHQTLDVHKLLGFASMGGVLAMAAWRFALRGQFPQRAAALYLVLSLAGMAAIGGAGYYGGEMVYEHGAGVRAIDRFARERYWRQVREVYRAQPSAIIDHAAHGSHD